ncbi:hypothetical protein YC2023_075344 [Brassica napus]
MEVKGLDTFTIEILHSGQYILDVTLKVKMFSWSEVYLGMSLLKYFPVTMVDTLVTVLARGVQSENRAGYSKVIYLQISLQVWTRPTKTRSFPTKLFNGKTPTIYVGTVQKIRQGKIQLPFIVINGVIKSIQGKTLTFENGLKQDFDAIVFAIGYKSSLCNWLKGIAGAAQDAMSVAEDIKSILATIKKTNLHFESGLKSS